MGSSSSQPYNVEQSGRTTAARPSFLQRIMFNSIRDQVEANDRSFQYRVSTSVPTTNHPPRVAKAVDMSFILDKSSVSLIPTESPGFFNATLTFKASSTGSLTFIYGAQREEKALPRPIFDRPPHIQHFDSNLGENITLSSPFPLHLDQLSSLQPDHQQFHVVLIFSNGANETLCYYYRIELRRGKPTLILSFFDVFLDGVCYNIQELYGQGDESQCVVCLTNDPDTSILPCRHSIICLECAQTLTRTTNKCPVCRGYIEGLMKLED
ncbi:hypothetical protein P9112_012023 [Eukaryota sp. TZLM1-RC]